METIPEWVSFASIDDVAANCIKNQAFQNFVQMREEEMEAEEYIPGKKAFFSSKKIQIKTSNFQYRGK